MLPLFYTPTLLRTEKESSAAHEERGETKACVSVWEEQNKKEEEEEEDNDYRKNSF